MPVSLILALVLVMPTLSGCFPKAAEPAAPEPTPPPEEVEPIIIGAPTMLSGPAAADGTSIINGMIMAIEEVNARGGLLGMPLPGKR